MQTVKKIVKVSDKYLQIELPEEFRNEIVEIVVRVKKDIEKDILADKIKIDTTKWKFNREEIHER